MTTETITFKNFNIKMFNSLLSQNLIVDDQITIKFKEDFVKSSSITISGSMVKLWSVKTDTLIVSEKDDNQIENEFDTSDDDSTTSTKPTFEPFNFYVFLGRTFKNYLSVYDCDSCTMTIDVNRETNIASTMTIEGQTTAGTNLKTKYILSSDDIITYKNQDYDALDCKMIPSETSQSFTLSADQVKEIGLMVKNLHKVDPKNCTYLKFNCDYTKNVITISDNVFVLNYPRVEECTGKELPLVFNLLKSDFIVAGNHTYTFHVEPNPDTDTGFVIAESTYKNCVISCLISKAIDTKTTKSDDMGGMDQDDFDASDIEIDDYFNE